MAEIGPRWQLSRSPAVAGQLPGTGLVGVMADCCVTVATPTTLGLYAFLSAGMSNLFISSGGGQWAVQAPIFLEAAAQVDVAPEVIVPAIACGNQWTNLIQPFWTTPPLAAAGFHYARVFPTPWLL